MDCAFLASRQLEALRQNVITAVGNSQNIIEHTSLKLTYFHNAYTILIRIVFWRVFIRSSVHLVNTSLGTATEYISSEWTLIINYTIFCSYLKKKEVDPTC